MSEDQLWLQFRKVSTKPKEPFMSHLNKLLDAWVEAAQTFTHAQLKGILIKEQLFQDLLSPDNRVSPQHAWNFPSLYGKNPQIHST